ncbi:hypothetical protein ACOMHN_033019 [Nucella lapillus]
MDLSFIKQIRQQVLIDSKSYLSREVYHRIRQLGLCKKPRTARHCRAGRLHRLWHNLPPAAPAQHNVTPPTSTTDLPDTTPADNNPPLLPALTLVYLTNLLNIYTPSRTLRSASDPLILRTPRTKLKSFGPRAFPVSGPLSWNKLPLSVRQQSTFSTYKTSLKTHLFSSP